MKNILVLVFLVLLLSQQSWATSPSIDPKELRSPASTQTTSPGLLGDNWPWPFGSECPFPWDEVEGSWIIDAPKFSAQFVISVTLSPDMPGKYILSLSHINQQGAEIATGHGYGGKDRKIIRAAMTYTHKGITQSFWVMLRAFADDANKGNGFNCQKSSLSLVITFRPMNCDCDDHMDEHYEMLSVPQYN